MTKTNYDVWDDEIGGERTASTWLAGDMAGLDGHCPPTCIGCHGDSRPCEGCGYCSRQCRCAEGDLHAAVPVRE